MVKECMTEMLEERRAEEDQENIGWLELEKYYNERALAFMKLESECAGREWHGICRRLNLLFMSFQRGNMKRL